MEHTSIKRAFENAKNRENTDDASIYMIFQRLALCFNDIYYLLIGNKEQVAKAIEKCYEQTEQNKKEDWDSDEIRALETPFDTHCEGICITRGIKKCNYHDKKDKCASKWFHHEFKSQNEMQEYINTIPSRLEHPFVRFEIWNMTEHGLFKQK